MLRERGLTVSGRKQELILRLQKVLASGFHNDAARADPKKVSPVKRPFRTPLGIANNIGELENHVMDDTIVFSAKKKPRTDEGRGTLRRQHMVAALSKALSDAENMLG